MLYLPAVPEVAQEDCEARMNNRYLHFLNAALGVAGLLRWIWEWVQ